MNQPPPADDRDVDELYRRWSARDSSRPSEAVRRAVLRHAANLEHAPSHSVRRWTGRRWSVIYGGLAAATLAGFLIAPRFLTAPGPTSTSVPQPPTTAPAPARAPITPTPAPASPVERQAGELARSDVSRARSATHGEAFTEASPHAQSAPPSARLAEAAAPRDSTPKDSDAALRQAAETANLGRLNALLGDHLDINARDSEGRTALMLAVLRGHKKVVDALLAGGADPRLADSSGITPLQAALDADRQAIAADLRRAGAE